MNRLIIITGASRGIGAAIAIEFNKRYRNNTKFILIARDLVKLNEVKSKMQEANDEQIDSNEILQNDISILNFDFSNKYSSTNDYINCLSSVIGKNFKFNELFVIYNHGTLDYGSIIDVTDDLLHEKFQINFFSIWHLLNAIQTLFPEKIIPKQYHININSSYATNPVSNWALQCSARSSRQMLFKCLALEKQNFRVLNYEPGIVYTDMLKDAYISTEMYSEQFKRDYEEGNFVKAEDTVKKLIEVLENNAFQSGSNVQYAPYKLH